MKPTRIYERKHRQTRLHRMMIAVRHFTSYLQTIGVLLLIALTLSGCFVLSGSGLPTDSSPTPTIVSRPTASPTPVPTLVSTPIPPRSPENGALYDAEVQEYTGLVVEKNMIQAYHMLSTILQGQMTFQQFLANSDYTLPQGCATPGEIVYSIQQLDGTWSINLTVKITNCSSQCGNIYNWIFQLGKEQGEIVITQAKLVLYTNSGC